MINYPFKFTYDEIPPEHVEREGWREWRAYDDNWTDGALHQIFLTPDGQWLEFNGSVYDDSKQLTTGNPDDRTVYPIEPYTAQYYIKDGKFYCPNGHGASYNYPYPGCSDRNCPFLRYRQHHYSTFMGTNRQQRTGAVRMAITIDGKPFENPYEKK